MTTTALAIYDPDLIDAGRGLRFSGPWLVSSSSAARVRWMAPWLQLVISEGWNASVLAGRWLAPRLARTARWAAVPRRAQYPAYALAAALAVLVHLLPVALPAIVAAALVAVFARRVGAVEVA